MMFSFTPARLSLNHAIGREIEVRNSRSDDQYDRFFFEAGFDELDDFGIRHWTVLLILRLPESRAANRRTVIRIMGKKISSRTPFSVAVPALRFVLPVAGPSVRSVFQSS